MPQFDLGSLESCVKYRDGGVERVCRPAGGSDNMPTLVKKSVVDAR